MTVSLITGKAFPRGAKKSPRHKLLAANPFRTVALPPPQFAIVPKKLHMWGNDQYGDCVSAEEAFAKACYDPEIFIPEDVVVGWAGKHDFLNGADLAEVLDAMKQSGFPVANQLYDDGSKAGVDYSNETVLRAAIASGPVKIAIDADALPSGAGNQQGWHAFGKGNYGNTDHCTGLSGYGTAGFCFQALGVPVPSGVDPSKPDCYLHFTWGTIGVVDHPWLMGTCTEAWVRSPTTVGVPPLPAPNPNPNPDPTPVPPPPGPGPNWWQRIVAWVESLWQHFFHRPSGLNASSINWGDLLKAILAIITMIEGDKQKHAGFNWQQVLTFLQQLLQLIQPLVPSGK